MSPHPEEEEEYFDVEPEDAKLMMEPQVLDEVREHVTNYIR